MSPKQKNDKVCPICDGKASYLKEYKKYYCFSCNKYVDPVEDEEEELEPEQTQVEATATVDEEEVLEPAQTQVEATATEDPTKECPDCGNAPSFIEEFKKFYCFTCEKYIEPKDKMAQEEKEETATQVITEDPTQKCPQCGDIPSFIEEYQKFYCFSCEKYIEPVPKESSEKPPAVPQEPTPIEKSIEENEKELGSISSTGTSEPEDYVSEIDSGHHDVDAEKEAALAPKSDEYKDKKKYTKTRYRTRMIKGSILPILFGLISIQMMNSQIYQFPDTYEYEVIIILSGFLLGFTAISGITFANLIRARKNIREGCDLKITAGLLAYILFIFILIVLWLFESLSTAWQFSTGFFLAAIFPLLIVTLYELASKGKFFVRELADESSIKRKLIFMQ